MRRHLRRLLPYLFVLAALAAAGWAVLRDRDRVLDAVGDLGWSAVAASLVLGVVGTYATFLCWRAVLRGLGATVSAGGSGAAVFFVTQLGKYLPGSVWPVVAQMEYGRRRGVGRATMLAANALTIAIGVAVGLVVAAATLPLSSPEVFARFWWALLALPSLLAVLHPRVLPWLLDTAMRRIGREPSGLALGWGTTLAACGWFLVSWLAYGVHVHLLLAGAGGSGWRLLLASVGGFALASSAGLLAVPVPAGAGVREVVLLATLAPAVGTPLAVAVTLVSRVLLLVVDLLLAAGGAVARRVSDPSGARPSSSR